ncbi:MAG: aldolase [Patescibacteria group bacterium]|nr:MAG: aldolase [Patescibacteria group bacterium]
MVNPQEIDTLVYSAVFGTPEEKQNSRYKIWQLGKENGVLFASINDFYMARGRGEVTERFTVPAMNLRGMTYDLARSAFVAAKNQAVGPMIFEIARSEMGYTDQTPLEYTTVVLAAALREGWQGPLFIQGDHIQAKAASMGVPKEGEIESIKDLVRQAVAAGFYNIDIDMSTLVDLNADSVEKEQIPNIIYSLELAKFVRGIEPKGITISLGGEIGHIGGKNSTVEDFRAFILGFNAGLPKDMVGISKISVATGTSHGGVVLADGTLADIALDFSILSSISKVCREEFKIGGTVQHGASTLPENYFSEFPKSDAIEVHLATGFQNIQMDHPQFPKELLSKMYAWIDETKQSEREEGQTDAQFHYSLRKKAWGKFKKECWDMAESNRMAIMKTLTERFEFLFKQLGVVDTRSVLDKYIKPVLVEKTEKDFVEWADKPKDVVGLSD